MKFEKSENVFGLLKLCAHFKDAIETDIRPAISTFQRKIGT